MPTYAVINGELIENLIVAENLETATEVTGKNCIEYDQSELRITTEWKWDGNNFIDPNPLVQEDINL
jgi:hypothetical protein